MYAVNSLSSYTDVSSITVLQGVKKLIRYLAGCPRHTIMDISGLGSTTSHELYPEVSLGNFHSQNI